MHDWNGREYSLTPDPYGRWIIGANYLTAIDEYAAAGDVARALGKLAAHAGDTGIPSLDPRLDPKKQELRSALAEEHVALFDLFAPGSATLPDPERAVQMAEALVHAATATDPSIEPRPALARVQRPVHILHGRRDHLIPFSESLRLQEALPGATQRHVTITRLFGHNAQDSFPSFMKALREVPVFLAALRRVLRLV
jgi:pimeloyl-ACP methyl ester carboxylesterase